MVDERARRALQVATRRSIRQRGYLCLARSPACADAIDPAVFRQLNTRRIESRYTHPPEGQAEDAEAESSEEAVSVEDPATIDFVAVSPDGGVLLVMVEGRPWDGSDQRLRELQEKLNAYATFVTSGELTAKYPDLADRALAIELRSVTDPDPPTAQFLATARDRLAAYGLRLTTRLIGERPSG